MSERSTLDLAQRLDGVVGRTLHRFGSPRDVARPPEPTVADGGDGPAAPTAADAASLVDAPSRREAEVLSAVDVYLERGRALKRWWQDVFPRRAFRERFDLARTFNEATESFGFFDTAAVDGEPMEVMGNYQEMIYDRPKHAAGDPAATAAWMRDQLREFVLRYFMRISDFRGPRGFTDTWRPALSSLLSLFSWCPKEAEAQRGFGFRQLWYKERGGARRVRRFADREAYAIVDLRELVSRYEWIVVEVSIFDFEFAFAPLGSSGPSLSLPLQESSYLVLTADLVEHEEKPEPGVLGRYGIGYAFIRNANPGLLQYGPGEFDAAIELIRFEVLDDGSVHVPMVFIANLPQRIVRLDVDPLDLTLDAGLLAFNVATFGLASAWVSAASRLLHAVPRPRWIVDPVLGYVAVADRVSGGLASEQLCIDKRQLEKEFLVKHYMQHYQAIAGSLTTWRLVPDWCDEAALPRWVQEGRRP